MVTGAMGTTLGAAQSFGWKGGENVPLLKHKRLKAMLCQRQFWQLGFTVTADKAKAHEKQKPFFKLT